MSGTSTSPQHGSREPQKVTGTRPEGVHDEHQARQTVREMFSRIAPRYDFLNHFLSFQFDRVWRRRAARRFRSILSKPGARVLDLCCGTGDLAFALAREANRAKSKLQDGDTPAIWGSDFAHPMLLRAVGKAAPVPRIHFLEADALNLPFPDCSFDLVTSAFGFRNLANYRAGLSEMLRVVKPGGEAGILEFAEPRGLPLAPLYRVYFKYLLPRIGGAISGSSEAYRYLPQSVMKFSTPEELVGQIRDSGFRTVTFERWTLGIVALYRAQKS